MSQLSEAYYTSSASPTLRKQKQTSQARSGDASVDVPLMTLPYLSFFPNAATPVFVKVNQTQGIASMRREQRKGWWTSPGFHNNMQEG